MYEFSKTKPKYKIFSDNPFNMQLYTLKNGLKLFMSVNPIEPRVFTNIAFRVGSKHDPKDTTGLAHYMEHMLFKGSSKIGTLDWEKEKVLLEQISDLFEVYRKTTDEAKRKELYKQIDDLSVEAAQYASPSEYHKLVSSLGAQNTNAYTWVEQTVYVNDIPANELDRWMELEAERFNALSLRLFHTELETVYEEYNIGQDNDFRKSGKAMRELMFPNHSYGTQTTIGDPEHLRNPSMANIQKFFTEYYVANNMAIVLSGDFVVEEAIELAEKHFGDFRTGKVPTFEFEDIKLPPTPARKTVVGKESPWVDMGWRFRGSHTDDYFLLVLFASILHNGQAGLLDLNLNQSQKVLSSAAWLMLFEDYTAMGLRGEPREGQTLEEVEALLLEQIEKLKKGEFEEWLLEAAINDLKIAEIKSYESNNSRVSAMSNLFLVQFTWERFQRRYEFYGKLTKADIVAKANEFFTDSRVVIHKESGEDEKVVKVEKPPITSIELNRNTLSDYAQEMLSRPVSPLVPVFADFDKDIQKKELKQGLNFAYVENDLNELFELYFIYEMGGLASNDLNVALSYLPYLGTSKYTPAQVQQELFRLGLTFKTTAYNKRVHISLKGLDSALEEGLALIEHLMAEAVANEEALQNVIEDILTDRKNDKQKRNVILREAMLSYVKYGEKSPFTSRHSVDELKELKSEQLLKAIKSLRNYEHTVYYYGPRQADKVVDLVNSTHETAETLLPPLPNKKFEQLETPQKVYFVDFPIVQTDLMLVSKGTPHFNLDEYTIRRLYNEYFGYGLSSIVFQEIREARALAYSTYAYASAPQHKDQAHYLSAYVGTQPDKIETALSAMLDIVKNMPVIDSQIEQATISIQRQLETDRVAPNNVYWESRACADRGYDRDLYTEIYNRMMAVTPEDLIAYQQKYVKDSSFALLVLGDKKRLDMDYLAQYGEIEELSLDQIFNY